MSAFVYWHQLDVIKIFRCRVASVHLNETILFHLNSTIQFLKGLEMQSRLSLFIFICVCLFCHCIAYHGYCFNGECPTLDRQCENIWEFGSSADQMCYDQFNTKGSINGHCGKDANGDFRKCELEYVLKFKFLITPFYKQLNR